MPQHRVTCALRCPNRQAGCLNRRCSSCRCNLCAAAAVVAFSLCSS